MQSLRVEFTLVIQPISFTFFSREISFTPASLFMIFPCVCLTSVSGLCPTVLPPTQSPLFFQCSVCLIAHQVLVSSLQTPCYLFLCFTYNPKKMCDTLRSFLSVFDFLFHFYWFIESCSPFPWILSNASYISKPPWFILFLKNASLAQTMSAKTASASWLLKVQ